MAALHPGVLWDAASKDLEQKTIMMKTR